MSRSDLLNPRRKLPDLSLPDRSGTSRRVRAQGDRSSLLVLIHDRCEACRAWAGRLAEQAPEIATWKGEARLVASSPPDVEPPIPFLLDGEGRLASSIGVRPPAVIIADQWGEIHEAAEAGEDHAFLPIESIVEWVRHLATQCPECEGEAY